MRDAATIVVCPIETARPVARRTVEELRLKAAGSPSGVMDLSSGYANLLFNASR